MKYIVIDIETTGLNALYGDRVTAIGCKKPNDIFICSEEDEKTLLSTFYNWITGELGEDVVLVGHNLKKFDIPFLWIRFLKNGMDAPDFLLDMKQIDTFEITKGWVSLNDFAKILNAPQKNGSGFEAINLWSIRNINGLLAYLKQDLITTEEVLKKLLELKTIEV